MAALVLGARTTGDVTVSTGLGVQVEESLRRLRSAGLVVTDGSVLRVREELFKEATRVEQANRAPEDPFVRDGRLVKLPAQRGRRRAVLEQVSTTFEPGRRYPEREVAEVLKRWCEGGEVDHVAVRRYLVDEGLLSRADGEYWRTGGPAGV